MRDFKTGEIELETGAIILAEGENSSKLYRMIDGMALRYKLLKDGRRQVISVVFPGDMLGLQAGLLGEMKHSIETVSRSHLCVFDRQSYWANAKKNPDHALDIAWRSAVEEHFLSSSLVSLGQRTARERLAWALIRLFKRGKTRGLVSGKKMSLPIRQQDLADALGLSLVHTNKTLASLKEQKMIEWKQGTLTVLNEDKLQDVALADASDFEELQPQL